MDNDIPIDVDAIVDDIDKSIVKTIKDSFKMSSETEKTEKHITQKEYLMILGLFTLANKHFVEGQKVSKVLESVLSAMKTGKSYSEKESFDWVIQETFEETPDLVSALAKEKIFIKD